MKRKEKKSTLTQDSSKSTEVLSISQLADSVSNPDKDEKIQKLEDKIISLTLTIDKYMKDLADRNEEISHLKHLLTRTTPVIGDISPLIITDEEIIAETQLAKIKANSQIRELTLDEIKKLDLLVKNKRLAQGNATTIETNKLPTNTPKNELMKLALTSVKNKKDE